MKYRIDDNTVLEFDQQVIATFNKYKQMQGRQESGGILLGKIFENKITIKAITTPDSRDKAGLAFFNRSRRKAQDIVNKTWNYSKGEKIYLGEWHTHSESCPQPSPTDKSMIRTMLRDSIMEIDFLLTVIVGIDDYWVGLQKGNKLKQLERC
ncbi:MAG: Mov34/MPN/PAD-1 family protein [Nitrospirae bacterium]|nr:Mov34/MPN/PAD-1 family protein [Nitrospirota bacterium]